MSVRKEFNPTDGRWYVVSDDNYHGATPTADPEPGSHDEFVAYLHSPALTPEAMRDRTNATRRGWIPKSGGWFTS